MSFAGSDQIARAHQREIVGQEPLRKSSLMEIVVERQSGETAVAQVGGALATEPGICASIRR
ncbi:hypothetical protein ABIB73_000077 [Bradyrhizobium sp. F1.4.3]